jgi:hypothetical protein
MRKCRSYANDDSPDDHSDAVHVDANTDIRLNNDDLHHLGAHSVSIVELSLADYCDSSDDDRGDNLDIKQVVRCYSLKGDVRFLSVFSHIQMDIQLNTILQDRP